MSHKQCEAADSVRKWVSVPLRAAISYILQMKERDTLTLHFVMFTIKATHHTLKRSDL